MLIPEMLDIMAQAPPLLRDLIAPIPPEMLKAHRKSGKWCIHEHACHLAVVQEMVMGRFKKFQAEEHPVFVPYIPGKTVSEGDLMAMDLEACLDQFEARREELLRFLETFTAAQWQREGTHPEYFQYSASTFLRHIMLHDQFHMFRIEELWLTKDEYLA